MSDGIAAFLAARLDEEEAAAKGALAGPWHIDRHPMQGLRIMDGPGLVVTWTPGFYERGDADAEHIARHDPPRVLRDVAADRALLDLYERAKRYRDQVFAQPGPRSVSDEMRAVTQMLALEQVLRLRAAVWSDHPDYRSEWAPT